MPRVQVPLRYLTTRFAAAMWPFDGFCVYLASIFVIVAMSGHVDVASHVREPMIDCIFSVSLGVRSGSKWSRLILSTGRPLRYGVGGHVTAGPSRFRDVRPVVSCGTTCAQSAGSPRGTHDSPTPSGSFSGTESSRRPKEHFSRARQQRP